MYVIRNYIGAYYNPLLEQFAPFTNDCLMSMVKAVRIYRAINGDVTLEEYK